jgi:ADP-ribosyl-[dinitrogen reductase] hydrolase
MNKVLLHNNLNDSLTGSLVGLAVGDCMGLELQTNWAVTVESVLKSKQLLHWSDDTSMALCLADSLLECGGYNSFDVMMRYHNWLYQDYRRSQSTYFDFGVQVATAIDEFYHQESFVREGKSRVDYCGNGGIMRLSPAVIAAYKTRTIPDILELARISSRETHYNYLADATAEVMAAMICTAIQNKRKSSLSEIQKFSTGKLFDEVLFSVNNAIDDTPQELEPYGNAVETLSNAVWALMNHNSFADGMEAVLKLGGDMDTNAAVYGQIAGAFYGYSSIPNNWKNFIYQEADIKKLAEQLIAMKTCPILETRFEEDEKPLSVNKK